MFRKQFKLEIRGGAKPKPEKQLDVNLFPHEEHELKNGNGN